MYIVRDYLTKQILECPIQEHEDELPPLPMRRRRCIVQDQRQFVRLEAGDVESIPYTGIQIHPFCHERGHFRHWAMSDALADVGEVEDFQQRQSSDSRRLNDGYESKLAYYECRSKAFLATTPDSRGWRSLV